ncbi:hypothetical protein CPT_Slocum_145 [Serratia phage Slocum]|nr:hypothetical protein CPT_Slocum_145 [Serratia phage Slocum]URC22566.1 hypothetical protein KAMAJI_01380 [Serratia phage vB_SmaM-Kamaji]
MGKWDLPKRKTKPLPKPKEVIICRVVPPRLASLPNIAEWLMRGDHFVSFKVRKDHAWVLLQRYKELRELGFNDEL